MNLGQGGFETGLQGRGARRVQKAGPSMPFFVIYDQGGCFTYRRPCHELWLCLASQVLKDDVSFRRLLGQVLPPNCPKAPGSLTLTLSPKPYSQSPGELHGHLHEALA